MIEVRPLGLGEVLEIRTPRLGDERGFFSETWSAEQWHSAGIDYNFMQDNHSFSRDRGVLRGLHYQLPPLVQAKLVRVTRGAVFDVAVDLRRHSPSFRQWVGLIVSADEWNQILVPAGFAHGFVTLEPDTEVQYKVSAPYSPEHERAIRFDDPKIGIEWPVAALDLTLSARDGSAPLLADVETF
jgi:dTDP-4-dehydrorhamnose 3,5-epimerase